MHLMKLQFLFILFIYLFILFIFLFEPYVNDLVSHLSWSNLTVFTIAFEERH